MVGEPERIRMNSRLKKLRAQRELILKHLQWIDQEIADQAAAESGPPPIPALDPPTPAEDPISGSMEETTAPALPLEALEEPNVQSLKNDVRKGCLLYFGLAWVALAAVVGVVYLIYS